ncbi:MAG TPA: site-2 protease family protein [Actinomycetes bacterium]
MGSPLFLLRDDPQLFIAFVVAVVVGITVHEFSHAAVATAQGDYTAKSQGRLTLNPASHLDPLGTIFLIVGGFGWGRPTPFNPLRLRRRRAGAALVGLAGPVSNVVLAILAAITLRVTNPNGLDAGSGFAPKLLFVLVELNVILAVFNLLPIPPLDGSRLLSIFLPPSRQNVVYFLDRYGIFLLIGLLLLAPNIFQPLFNGLTRAILRLVGFGV